MITNIPAITVSPALQALADQLSNIGRKYPIFSKREVARVVSAARLGETWARLTPSLSAFHPPSIPSLFAPR